MEIAKKGILFQEKPAKDQKCGTCDRPLVIQVYHYKGAMRKLVHCKKCNTFSRIKKQKKYMEFPDSLNKKK